MLVTAILIDSGDEEKTDLVYKFYQKDDERVFVPVKSVNTTALTNKKFNLKELDSYSGLYLLEIYGTQYFCKN